MTPVLVPSEEFARCASIAEKEGSAVLGIGPGIQFRVHCERSAKDGRWNYRINGSDGKACLLSARRYRTFEALVGDLVSDFRERHVEYL